MSTKNTDIKTKTAETQKVQPKVVSTTVKPKAVSTTVKPEDITPVDVPSKDTKVEPEIKTTEEVKPTDEETKVVKAPGAPIGTPNDVIESLLPDERISRSKALSIVRGQGYKCSQDRMTRIMEKKYGPAPSREEIAAQRAIKKAEEAKIKKEKKEAERKAKQAELKTKTEAKAETTEPVKPKVSPVVKPKV